MKKAILVVSFGTSHLEQKKESIDPCIQDIKKKFPQWDVYESFSSSFLRRHLELEYGLKILSPEACMEDLKEKGYQYIIIQPLFLIEGIEYDKLLMLKTKYQDEDLQDGLNVEVGKVLLSTRKDYEKVVKELEQIYSNLDTDLLVLGHGTSHEAHQSYDQLQQMLDTTMLNCKVTTLQDRNDLERMPFKKNQVTIVPFMLVSGMHILRDVMGEHRESFRSGLQALGKEVHVVQKGLGSYKSTREVYIVHIQEIVNKWKLM